LHELRFEVRHSFRKIAEVLHLTFEHWESFFDRSRLHRHCLLATPTRN
jgi:hypothetical protein